MDKQNRRFHGYGKYTVNQNFHQISCIKYVRSKQKSNMFSFYNLLIKGMEWGTRKEGNFILSFDVGFIS